MTPRHCTRPGCPNVLPAGSAPQRRYCRTSDCTRALNREKKAKSRARYRERRRQRGLRHGDPIWPFVGVLDYISTYGAGGPLNPELDNHLDHDAPKLAKVYEFPELEDESPRDTALPESWRAAAVG